MSVEAKVKKETTPKANEITQEQINANSWAIRQCFLYKEEYKECKSIRGRFHQYFIHGETIDCLGWKRDYDNCNRYENDKDLKAAQAVVESETERRRLRLKDHYDNDVWTKRKEPPSDWDKTLPDWFLERNKNTLLAVKSRQQQGEDIHLVGERTLCTIM